MEKFPDERLGLKRPETKKALGVYVQHPEN